MLSPVVSTSRTSCASTARSSAPASRSWRAPSRRPSTMPTPKSPSTANVTGGAASGRRERAKAVVVAAARAHERRLLDAPVVQLAVAPGPAVDEHAVAVLRVGLEASDPDVVVLVGLGARDDAAAALDLDRRRVRTAPSRRRSSRYAAWERRPRAPRRRRSATRRRASRRGGSRSRPRRSAPCRGRARRGAGTPRNGPRDDSPSHRRLRAAAGGAGTGPPGPSRRTQGELYLMTA